MSTYGTNHDTTHADSIVGYGNDEEQPLLSSKSEQPPLSERVRQHMGVKVSTNHVDLILLLCYVITGLLDSCATQVWGSFVSMQTGNTIYFGLGLANPSEGTRWIKAGTSIGCFCVGSFCFSRYHAYFGGQKRWVLLLSFVFQMLMIVVSAIVTVIYQKSSEPSEVVHWHVMVPLAIIAFQSSGQAVTSRVMECGGLTTVVLTSSYCDLFSDLRLFAPPSANKTRNHRFAAPVLLLIGAVAGGGWSNSDIGLAGALWTAAGLKFLVVIAWLLWQRNPESEAAD